MVQKTLNKFKDTKGLSEIGQSLIVRMAYVHKELDGTYTQLHNGVKCRDFLGDALWATQQKLDVYIYGFSFKGTKEAIDLDKTRYVLDFEDCRDNKAFFIKNLPLLHEIEAQHNLVRTRIYQVKDQPNKLIVEGSKFWLKSVFNVSLYTFLFKAMCYQYKNINYWFNELESFGGTESSYAKQIQSVWPFYLKYLKKINRGTFNVTGRNLTLPSEIGSCHNYCGFVSMRFMTGKSFFERRMKKLHKEYKNDF